MIYDLRVTLNHSVQRLVLSSMSRSSRRTTYLGIYRDYPWMGIFLILEIPSILCYLPLEMQGVGSQFPQRPKQSFQLYFSTNQLFNARYTTNRPLSKANIMDDPLIGAMILSCAPEKFGFTKVPGYQTGTVRLQIRPVATIMGFINLDTKAVDSVFNCPGDVTKLLEIVNTAIN